MEIFLKLIDKVISLVKAREENKVKLFNEVVQPLYEEFEKLVAQYFSFFRSTLQSIGDKELEIIVQDLRKQRDEYVQARIKIVSMSEAIKVDIGNSDILEFCNALKSFFFVSKENELLSSRGSSMLDDPNMQQLLMYAQEEGRQNSRGSMLLHELERFMRKQRFDGNNEIPLEKVMFYIEDELTKMEESWSSASSIYAKLRINYLLSKSI